MVIRNNHNTSLFQVLGLQRLSAARAGGGGYGNEAEEEADCGRERRAHHARWRGEPQPRQEAQGFEEAEGVLMRCCQTLWLLLRWLLTK